MTGKGFLALVLGPFLLAAVVIGVTTALRGGQAEVVSGAVYRFEIPEGTADRMARGQQVNDVFPERMGARVGDTFEVTNYDSVAHQLGPLAIRAGETASITFHSPGTYIGACTVGDHTEVTIVVSGA